MAAAVTGSPFVSPSAVPRLGLLLLTLAVALLWLVTFEAGPVSEALGQAGSFLHELFHDGRHLVGVPCH
jgi:hypothetical protein